MFVNSNGFLTKCAVGDLASSISNGFYFSNCVANVFGLCVKPPPRPKMLPATDKSCPNFTDAI